MSKPFFIVEFELCSLKNFLDSVINVAICEIDEIEKRNKDEAYPEFEDYEAAFDFPIARIDIACRAVLYELVALVETKLQYIADEPWSQSSKHKGPQNIFDSDRIDNESFSKVKMVSDLRFNDIVALIEEHYRINLNSLPEWEKILELRNMVNSFKHSQGFMDFRKIIKWQEYRFGQCYRVNTETAYSMISSVRIFLKTLESQVNSL